MIPDAGATEPEILPPGDATASTSRSRRLIGQASSLFRTRTGIVLLATIVTSVIRVVSTVILTRLLNAEIFGIIGVLTTINVIFGLLSDLGFFQYVIRQKDHDSAAMLDEVWTIRLVRSVTLVVLISAASPLIARYVNLPYLTPAIVVASLVVLAEGLSSMAFATAPRANQIARLSLLDLIPYVAQVVVSIALAWAFRSYWSIIGAMLAGASVRVLLSYRMFAQSGRRIAFSRARAADVWLFGRFILAATVMNLLLSQADKIFFARYFPVAQFGLYILATNIAMMPAQFVSAYVERILYPAFCVGVEGGRLSRSAIYYLTGRPIRLFYMFAVGGFITTAPVVIAILYDPRYQGAAPFLAVLSIGMLIRMPAAAANQFLMSIGQPRHVFGANIMRLAAFVAFAMLGITVFGPIGLLAGVVGMDVMSQCYCWVALKRCGTFDLRQEALFALCAAAGIALGASFTFLATPLLHLL